MYRIRFNLGRGDNYRKWKVLNIKTKEVKYFSPSEYSFVLYKVRLCNKINDAIKIFEGHTKYTCSWIECESYDLINEYSLSIHYTKLYRLIYDPKHKPFWTNFNNEELDNYRYDKIYLEDRKVLTEFNLDLKDYNNFIYYLNVSGYHSFQSKKISEELKIGFNLPKSTTLKFIKRMKENNLIKRVSQSGNCQTTCASCYEYGCDAGPQPPINYWKILWN